MSDNLTRRSFLLTGAAAAAFTIVPRSVLGGPRHIAPSDKLNIAGIGIGGQGAANLRNLETENIVALCDVDPLNYAAKTIAKYPKAKVYVDFREMLEKEQDLDAVVIATPDHTHAVISMAAMKAGKHVYCQKPLTHDVYEARMLAEAAGEIRRRDPDGNPGPLRRWHPPDYRVDPVGDDRRGAPGRCLVRSDLLPLGARLLELEVWLRPAQGNDAPFPRG